MDYKLSQVQYHLSHTSSHFVPSILGPKVVVWHNEGLDKRVGQGDFKIFFTAFTLVNATVNAFVHILLSQIKARKSKTTLSHILCSFQCFIIDQICQNEVRHVTKRLGIILVKLSVQKLPVIPRETIRNLP